MMNMVNNMYTHVSLGYPVQIVLTRIIILSNQVKEKKANTRYKNLIDLFLV